LNVVAEGVEMSAQAEFLGRHGCDQWQGYLMTPPVAADCFLAFVDAPPASNAESGPAL
jgi:EAL domain-containing protein (putative c-di-GMP-specific phosphodiesterase class I)